jgi:4-amino-4-deoxy-L-arabinose transferase-like glycosyltransferase
MASKRTRLAHSGQFRRGLSSQPEKAAAAAIFAQVCIPRARLAEAALTGVAGGPYHSRPPILARFVGVPTMPRLPPHHAAVWIAILAVALAARLAAGTWWQARLDERRAFYFPDSAGYWELARTLARGEPYQYLSPEARVFRAPGYPFLLAGLYILFPDGPPVMAGRVLSAILGTAAVAVAGWWTAQLFDARAGMIAGGITALYPGSVAMGAFVLSEAPFCPLMLAQLALWGMARRAAATKQAILWSLAAGTAGGLATLVRPSWLLFTPFAIAAGLVFAAQRRRQVITGAVMCTALALVMLPWWIRNARVTGHFVPTTLQVGASLYDGLNPDATGASDMSFVPKMAALVRAEEAQARGSEVFEYRLDRRLAREALDWTFSHPRRALELAGVKFARIWNVWPNEPAFRGWSVRLVMLATYVPLLILSLLGAWRFTAAGWAYVLAWLPAVYITLLHVVFVGSLRYREPAMMALAVLAAGVLAGSAAKAVPADGRRDGNPPRGSSIKE